MAQPDGTNSTGRNQNALLLEFIGDSYLPLGRLLNGKLHYRWFNVGFHWFNVGFHSIL
jgi:hypothetical protein